MILVESGIGGERGFEAMALFARQLQLRGHRVMLDAASLPEGMGGGRLYDAALLLAEPAKVAPSRLLVIGAENLSEEVLVRLRETPLAESCRVQAIGRFDSRQALIGARLRLSDALGRAVEPVDLGRLQPRPIRVPSLAPLFASGAAEVGAAEVAAAAPLRRPRLLMALPGEMLEDEATLTALEALANRPDLEAAVITSGQGRALLRRQGPGLPIAFGLAEFAPAILARTARMVAVFGPSVPGEQVAALCLEVLGRGGAVADCTEGESLLGSGAPVLRGPRRPAAFVSWLEAAVLPNLKAIGAEAARQPWLRANCLAVLEQALELPAPERHAGARAGGARRRRAARILFLPTNGVGLGHAQRAALVAAELVAAESGVQEKVGFAAFPSCIPLLQERGFDCLPLVARSGRHTAPQDNDLVNYLRLRSVLAAGDTLVFDGGYPFDSVIRTVLETQARAVWIRRGLWQPGQRRRTPLERQGFFSRVIVPAEAFEELNAGHDFGPDIRRVGPIVQPAGKAENAPQELRARLARRFGRQFRHLVVSMLGSGVAAERAAQLQFLCARFAAEEDVLHLMVVWPNARLAPGLAGWPNSHPVATGRALALSRAADLVISAAGYNSVHEMLYHAIPCIFIPQMAAFTDDQERRARAMSERGLAVTLQPQELLQLGREVDAFLHGGKAGEIRAALEKAELPPRGTAEAARLISEVARNGGG